jgi:hypothetical protein
MPRRLTVLSDHERLANARGYLQATVEELSRVKVFEKAIVEAANAITILHSILGEFRSQFTGRSDPRPEKQLIFTQKLRIFRPYRRSAS